MYWIGDLIKLDMTQQSDALPYRIMCPYVKVTYPQVSESGVHVNASIMYTSDGFVNERAQLSVIATNSKLVVRALDVPIR